MLRIGIIEDDPVIREGLEAFLLAEDKFEYVVAEGSVEEFLVHLENKQFDVVLSDIGLPGMSGIEGIPYLKEANPDVDIIMLTVYHDSDRIFKSLVAGAIGYLLKNTPLPDIEKAIFDINKGGSPMSPTIARQVIGHFQNRQAEKKERAKASVLTPREREIVDGIVDGLSYKMIANRYFISIETVRQHIKNIYRKLHVNSKAEVITKSLKGEI